MISNDLDCTITEILNSGTTTLTFSHPVIVPENYTKLIDKDVLEI
jgi:hypothetical protein